MSAASLKANEPSMEEILASIRRIIADDAGKADAAPDEPADDKATAAAPVAPVSDDAEDEDVLDLALVAAEPLVKIDLEPLPQSVELDEDIEFRVVEEPLVAEVAPEPEPVAVAPPPPPPPAPRTAKVGNEDDPCGCGSASPDLGSAVVVALALAIILAARRP